MEGPPLLGPHPASRYQATSSLHPKASISPPHPTAPQAVQHAGHTDAIAAVYQNNAGKEFAAHSEIDGLQSYYLVKRNESGTPEYTPLVEPAPPFV